jgi:hypothetical protein
MTQDSVRLVSTHANLAAGSELMPGSGRLLHIYGEEGMPYDSSSVR